MVAVMLQGSGNGTTGVAHLCVTEPSENGRVAAVSMTSSQTTGDPAAAGTEAVRLLLQHICEHSDVKKKEHIWP